MADSKKLQVAMFPWLAFGHILPFFELAKKIAEKGHTVFFISTPRNIKRLPKIPHNLSPLMNLVELPFPHEPNNLPQNAEATNDIPNHLIPFLMKAMDGLQEPLARFLETNTPDWIIYDIFSHWLPAIASKLGISKALFSIGNASVPCFFGPICSDNAHAYPPRTKVEHFTVSPEWITFPFKLAFKHFEAKAVLALVEENKSGVSNLYRCKIIEQATDVYLYRTCSEIEEDSLNFLRKMYGKHVIPVGLLPGSELDNADVKDCNWEAIVEWLNKQEKRSVVYVALGSEVQPSQEDITQLALGLEISGLPFFWALRKPNVVKLPGGFEERTTGRGIVCTDWVPQRKILGHESVGGFVTHCGWGSFLEGLQFGKPSIMLPFLYEQGLTARLFDKETGVEVPRNEQDGSFTGNSVAESIRIVVVEEQGRAYREKAKKMLEIFKDHLNDKYIEKLIEFMQQKKER
ncbi:hypothetical protein UlMin_038812 [Ulmus minor]